MRISACIIAKNESENIEDCIKSCKLLADQIIVADTGSDDDTVEKARAIGARVYDYQWCDDFAAAKNFAISKADGDWIFFPDADEYIDEASAGLLLAEIKKINKNRNMDAVTCSLHNIDKNTGELKKGAPITRIFRNSPDIAYAGTIHEKLTHVRGYLNHSSVPKAILYHTGYTAEILPQKHERNLKLLKELETQNKLDASNLYHIAGTLYALKRYAEAMEYIEKLENHKDYRLLIEQFSLMPNFFIIKSMVMTELEQRYGLDETLAAIEEGRRLFPQNCEIEEQKISILLQCGRYDEALSEYEILIGLYDESEKFTGVSFKRERCKAILGISKLYTLKGELENAFDYAIKAVAEDYTFELALLALLDAVRGQGESEIISFLNQFYNENSPEQCGFLTFVTGQGILPSVFEYYFSRLVSEVSARYQRYLCYHFLFIGEYQQARNLADSLAKQEENKEKKKELNVLRQTASALSEYDGKNSISGYDFDEGFDKALVIMIRLGKIELVEAILDFMPQDSADIIIKVAEVMQNVNFFDAAIDFYLMALKSAEAYQRVSITEGLGYCDYRIGDFEKAVAYYKQIEGESKQAEQFLKWMGEIDHQ